MSTTAQPTDQPAAAPPDVDPSTIPTVIIQGSANGIVIKYKGRQAVTELHQDGPDGRRNPAILDRITALLHNGTVPYGKAPKAVKTPEPLPIFDPKAVQQAEQAPAPLDTTPAQPIISPPAQ